MSEEIIVDKFWAEDFSILFRKDRILEFFVTEDQSTTEKLNSIARFGVYASVILALYHSDLKYLNLCIITFSVTYFVFKNADIKEPLENIGSCKKKVTFSEKEDIKEFEKDDGERTHPTLNNPFGNNSVFDIIENPERPPMIEYGSYSDESLKVKKDIESKFNYNLYKDLGDLYGKTNSQRQFYTTPSRGTIPHDSDGKFKNWLYGKMPSCKDNIYDCGRTLYETPQMKRPILPNSLENPDNTQARSK